MKNFRKSAIICAVLTVLFPYVTYRCFVTDHVVLGICFAIFAAAAVWVLIYSIKGIMHRDILLSEGEFDPDEDPVLTLAGMTKDSPRINVYSTGGEISWVTVTISPKGPVPAEFRYKGVPEFDCIPAKRIAHDVSYTPEKLHYGSATVGGVTTGGVYKTGGYSDHEHVKTTDKYDIILKNPIDNSRMFVVKIVQIRGENVTSRNLDLFKKQHLTIEGNTIILEKSKAFLEHAGNTGRGSWPELLYESEAKDVIAAIKQLIASLQKNG